MGLAPLDAALDLVTNGAGRLDAEAGRVIEHPLLVPPGREARLHSANRALFEILTDADTHDVPIRV